MTDPAPDAASDLAASVDWQSYEEYTDHDHTVAGDVRVSSVLDAPMLTEDRRLHVYLPPSYTERAADDERYPVLYMHDGQNLFDEVASYSGEWRVDETMQELGDEGIEAIVVGIPNAGDDRGDEYTPYPHPEHGGGDADAYLDFLFGTVKPLVDATFRTRPDCEHTGLAGSSLGGVISLYAFFEYPERVGFAGVLSPAFWWPGEEYFAYVEEQSRTDGRLYLDVGGQESTEHPELNEAYRQGAERMVELLREKGFGDDQIRFVVDEEGIHRESAWAERFPDAVRFLLADLS